MYYQSINSNRFCVSCNFLRQNESLVRNMTPLVPDWSVSTRFHLCRCNLHASLQDTLTRVLTICTPTWLWKALYYGLRRYKTVYSGTSSWRWKIMNLRFLELLSAKPTPCHKPEEILWSCIRLGVCLVCTNGRRTLQHNCQVHYLWCD